MVSFQCDGCADVVKKPKLDQHRARCGASFTCIDCSKTFPTPVDWKGHTSCISEAEKYQKSLYKPKPNGSGRENQSSYGKAGVGKFRGQGASWNRPPPRSQATGANGTPLGTPLRMSPVTAPPLQDEKTHTTVSDTAIAPVSKGETKKHKRKSEVTNETHVEPVTQATDGPHLRGEPKGEEGKDKRGKEGNKEKKGKKGKKEKKDQPENAVVAEAGTNGIDPSPLTADGTGDERPKKSKKEKKEKKDTHDPASRTEGDSNGVDPSSLSSSVPHDITGEEKLEKSKKKKKQKSAHAVETGDAVQDVPVKSPSADMVDGEEEKVKKKRRKSEVAHGEMEANGAVPETLTEEKPKKRKRGAEEPDVTRLDSATERKKKKKVALP